MPSLCSVVGNMFANKVVIIAGGSAGMGAGIAKSFAKEKASLAIAARNETKLKKVAQECEDLGAKVLVIKADISIDDEAKAIVEKTVAHYGKLDVLVNSAGILRVGSILEPTMMQYYDETMKTNLRAFIHLTHLAAPHLIATKGNIVNVSSVSSMTVYANMSHDCISKAGLDQFTKCAAVELGAHGVRVNSVNPGPVKTEMLAAHSADTTGESWKDMTVLGRISDTSEIGDLVLYLASDKARSITGASYVIDNGILLK